MKTYRSKVDPWLIWVIVGVVALPLGLTLIVGEGLGLMLILCVLMLAYVGWSILVTRYEVEPESVHIYSALFKAHIPIDMITSVKSTRYSKASPDWSLDRLEINYGNNKSVLISPKNKTAFLTDIGWLEKLGKAI